MMDTAEASAIMNERIIRKVKGLLEKGRHDRIPLFRGVRNTAVANAMRSSPMSEPLSIFQTRMKPLF